MKRISRKMVDELIVRYEERLESLETLNDAEDYKAMARVYTRVISDIKMYILDE